MAITVRNAGTEPDPDGARSVLRNSRFQTALSVPVELHGGPIGSLDLYSARDLLAGAPFPLPSIQP